MLKSEKLEIRLLWKILDDARKGPEGMGIKKLQIDALSTLKDFTNKYVVAAGGGGDISFSLMMKRMMTLVNDEMKRSLKKVTEELREARGAKKFFEKVEEGLQERIAGYQEEIEEHNVTSVAKEMKETRIETECAQASAEAANIALGQSEGELLSPKQHFGDTTKEVDTVTKKFRRSEDMNKRYEDNEEDPGHIQVAALVTS
jgi:hypothetical protein